MKLGGLSKIQNWLLWGTELILLSSTEWNPEASKCRHKFNIPLSPSLRILHPFVHIYLSIKCRCRERVCFSVAWCYKSRRERAAAVAVCLLREVYNFTNARYINPSCHVAALFVDQMGLKDLVEAFLIHLNNMTRNVILGKMNILEVQFEASDILTPAIIKRSRKDMVEILQNVPLTQSVLAPGTWLTLALAWLGVLTCGNPAKKL